MAASAKRRRPLSDALDLRFGFGERCTRGTRTGRTDAPTAGTEPVAGAVHDDLTGVSECLIERSLPVAVGGDRIAEQNVEQIIDRRVVPETWLRTNSAPSARVPVRLPRARTAPVASPESEFGECESGSVGAVDDHGREGVAGSGLEGAGRASTATRSRSVPSTPSTVARR